MVCGTARPPEWFDAIRAMRERDYLSPQSVYRFNAEFQLSWLGDALDLIDGKHAVEAVPALFDKATRSFRWISVERDIWKGGDDANDFMRRALTALVQGHGNGSLADLLAALPDNPEIARAKSVLGDAISHLPKGTATMPGDWTPPGGWESLRRALLAIYSGYPHDPRSNIEGVYYDHLESNGGDPAHGPLRGEMVRPGDDAAPPFLWLKLLEPQENECAEGKRTNRFVSLTNARDKRDSPPDAQTQKERSADEELAIDAFLKPLLMDVARFSKRIDARRHIAIAPVSDIWVGDQGFGGLQAVFLLFFETSDARESWLKEHYHQLASGFARLASQIAAARETTCLVQPIHQAHSLISHFLTVLPHIQDWEEAVVFAGEHPVARFQRKAERGVRTEWIEDSIGLDHLDGPLFPLSDSPIQSAAGRHFMWWTAGQNSTIDLWSDAFIPGLMADEVEAFGEISIRYEFPRAVSIPQAEAGRAFVREAYLRQQLDLMRLLAQKVRARRSSLRSAVAAIMGRNMSHNLGSHVLARVAGAAPRPGDTAEHLSRATNDLLAYLQRRMDFLAEIATSDQTFWSQPLSLAAQLSRLNLAGQIKALALGSDGRPPLLSTISGKENLPSSVEYQGDPAMVFSCPGGEVGAHALYIILENIIRNSARHGAGRSRDKLQLDVKATVSSDDPDLLQIRIVDPRTRLERDGRLVDSHREDKDVPLPVRINGIIDDAPILDSTGAPMAGFWGIREMQICAHYLRGKRLSELELKEPGPAVLRAGTHTLDNGSHCLKYEFYLQRPKIALIVRPGHSNREPAGLGIAAIEVDEEPDWGRIAEAARGYSFLIVDTNLKATAAINQWGAQLPVRTLQLAPDAIAAFLAKAIEGRAWIEDLHRAVALGYRDQHPVWQGRPIVGIAGSDCDALPLSGVDGPILFTRLADPYMTDTLKFPYPLDREFLPAPHLGSDHLAAIWLDHAGEEKFSPALGIDKAAQFDNAGMPERPYWISAEAANGMCVHSAALHEAARDGSGWELLAASLARVAILDERVQSQAGILARNGAPHDIVWKRSGICIPDKRLADLDFPDLEECRSFLINPPAGVTPGPIDCLVLHLSTLEALSAQVNGGLVEAAEALVDNTRAARAEIFIVTGRGVPSVAMTSERASTPKFRYLPVSALLENLVSNPSKLGLMRTLWSAAQPGVRGARAAAVTCDG